MSPRESARRDSAGVVYTLPVPTGLPWEGLVMARASRTGTEQEVRDVLQLIARGRGTGRGRREVESSNGRESSIASFLGKSSQERARPTPPSGAAVVGIDCI